jgi:NAD(P)-dependent dehydrogenase (short-subunit alcohol dehydrogenase family)
LVTGAARRGSIGRAIARALAEEGAHIVINDWQRQEEAQEMAEAIAAIGQESFAVEADVTRVEECRRLIEMSIARFGRLEILVNNAGFAQHRAFEQITESEFDYSIALHLKAPFFLCQFVAPIMRARGFGRIINISSEQAYIGYPELTHYTAAKAGLRTLTKSLALALAPSITVNTVCPGPTATEKFMAGPEYRDEIRDQIVLRRWVRPEDVARSVVFLASPDGDSFTGQTLDPNCGTVMP